MKKKDTSKPLMLYLAESIYFQLIKILKKKSKLKSIFEKKMFCLSLYP